MIKVHRRHKDAWKKETITSTKEAVAFLKHQLTTIRFKDVGKITNLNTRALKQENGLVGSIYGRFNDNEQFLMNIQIELSKDCILFKDLGIHTNLRGNKLAAIAVKCALAIAHEAKKETIKITNIINEGQTFWPYIGATPSTPTSFSQLLYCYKDWYSSHFTKKEHRQISKIIKTEQNSQNDKAWQLLGQCKIKGPDGFYLRDYISPTLCYKKTLLLKPNHPDTAEILQKRIGSLPSFKHPTAYRIPVQQSHNLTIARL